MEAPMNDEARSGITFGFLFALFLSGALSAQQPPEEPAAAIDKSVGDRVAELVLQLANDRYVKRQDASERLLRIGAAALPALREAAKKSFDPEVRLRSGIGHGLLGHSHLRATKKTVIKKKCK
jgi:hypothetical protein